MKTEIEKLIEQYPELMYEDGYLYPNPDDDGYLHENGVPLDGKHLIAEYFEGWSLMLPSGDGDPIKEREHIATGREFIKESYFENDYSEALKYIKS